MLTPAIEQRNALGMLFSSTLFMERAPPEHVALTAFVGGERQQQRNTTCGRPIRPDHSRFDRFALAARSKRGRGSAYDMNVPDSCLRLFREKGYAIPA